ncbi:MAG: 3-oxoacyl-[acyl-carrier-protein] synthase III C-terminal domain-containing protein [Edaphobacter sp.]
MRIASVGTAYPPHRYSQAAISEALTARWKDRMEEPRLINRLFVNCGVDFRNLVFPLDVYETLSGFGPTNDAWIVAALDLGQQAITTALDRVGLTAADISAIFFASVTGISSPTIDARLINRMPFPTHVKRTPIFGLGCVAGAAGIARASDYARAFPNQYVLLLSVELCSLTWQDNDQSIANLISCGLFGDGAAAVVIAGSETPPTKSGDGRKVGPKILDTRSTFYRNTEHIMGWDIGNLGFKIVLSPDVPKVVHEHLRGDVESFLADNGLSLDAISSYIFHSGGPKVLEAMETTLNLPPNALEPSWRSLREVGNLSAASVLAVLEDVLLNSPGAPGTYSILAAIGPAFCSELVLLQW